MRPIIFVEYSASSLEAWRLFCEHSSCNFTGTRERMIIELVDGNYRQKKFEERGVWIEIRGLPFETPLRLGPNTNNPSSPILIHCHSATHCLQKYLFGSYSPFESAMNAILRLCSCRKGRIPRWVQYKPGRGSSNTHLRGHNYIVLYRNTLAYWTWNPGGEIVDGDNPASGFSIQNADYPSMLQAVIRALAFSAFRVDFPAGVLAQTTLRELSCKILVCDGAGPSVKAQIWLDRTKVHQTARLARASFETISLQRSRCSYSEDGVFREIGFPV